MAKMIMLSIQMWRVVMVMMVRAKMRSSRWLMPRAKPAPILTSWMILRLLPNILTRQWGPRVVVMKRHSDR